MKKYKKWIARSKSHENEVSHLLLASFVEKNIFDLEISGGHFVYALKKFRPRVPKWHPADFCSGYPIVSESIIKHRPYRETRFSQNPLDYIATFFLPALKQVS